MKKIVLCFVLSLGSLTLAASLEGVSGIGICSENPAKLAAWYEKFGFTFKSQGKSYVGEGGTVFPIHFGIYPVSEGDPTCSVKGQGFGFNFSVSDFDGFLEKLKSQGVEPFSVMKESWGWIALFTDIEGNNVSIFSSPK